MDSLTPTWRQCWPVPLAVSETSRSVSLAHVHYLRYSSFIDLFAVFLHTFRGNEADDLPGSMKGMSLSPQHRRNKKDKWTPTVNHSAATTSQFAGNYSGPTFRFLAPPQAPVVGRRLPPPMDFVEPSLDDIIFRQVPDPVSPASAPRINPWTADYFLGDI